RDLRHNALGIAQGLAQLGRKELAGNGDVVAVDDVENAHGGDLQSKLTLLYNIPRQKTSAALNGGPKSATIYRKGRGMCVETITSVKNPLVASLRALKTAKARRETGLFLVEGETMLNEALSSGLVPRALLAEAETPLAARFPEARLVTRGVLE